jgi:hypothetical protein
MKDKKNNKEGIASPEQMSEWKSKYGEVYGIEYEDCISYVRKPNRTELSYIMSMQSDPLKMIETFIKSCFVGGCEKIKTDVSYQLGVAELMDKIINVKKAELVKS